MSQLKRDNTGLVKIVTGGHATNTKVTVDGTPVIVIKAVITIEPREPNTITLTSYSEQLRKGDTDPQEHVQTFYGISEENYAFFEGLMERISIIDDETLREYSAGERRAPAEIFNLLRFIQEARKGFPNAG